MPDPLDALSALKRELEDLPKVSIEKAAELLEVSPRTMYRRRMQFECVRIRGRLYVTIRSIKHYIEREQYSPTIVFDVTKKHGQFRKV
jgi:hypothetical protein